MDPVRKTKKSDLEFLIYYMDKMEVTYTIDRNPSIEKISRIKDQIKNNETIRNKSHIKDIYNN